jgi:hypothetical protein
LKKLFMSFLILNLAFLLNPQLGMSESIQGIIDNSYTDTAASSASSVKNKINFFSVQIGTFFSEPEANEQIIQLKSKGYEPYIFQSINSKGKNIYAARIGKFNSYDEAQSKIEGIQSQFNIPLLITYFDSLEPAPSSIAVPAKTKNAIYALPPDEPDGDLNETTTYTPDDLASLSVLQKKIQEMETEIQKLKDVSDIRRQLEITDEEAKAEEEDILEAAGREYTLTSEGTFKLNYGVTYTYTAYDAIQEGSRIEDVANHSISNNFGVSYGLKNNLTVGTSIPFKYKYHKVGTIDSMDTTDYGDLKLNWQLQPFKTGTDLPTIIFNGSFGIPVGKSPYDIQVGEELSTSSGIYDANFGASISQVSDPVVAFCSIGISYPFAEKSINQKRNEGILDGVDPGMGIGASVGLGYALSYKLNLNFSFSYSYSFETTYKYKNAPDAKSGTGTSASLSIGTGYKISNTRNLNFKIGIPITSVRTFTLGLSIPVDFAL